MSAGKRDHGGNLDAAIRQYGGTAEGWIDLSTGINRVPYPVPALDGRAWTALPTSQDRDGLIAAAREAYGAQAQIVPLAGAQAAIQLAPLLRPVATVRILSPTYNEHAAAFRIHGWKVTPVTGAKDLTGAEAAVIVNPNNPDGRTHTPAELRSLARDVGLLIVDESFADPTPDLSLASDIPENTLVMRSFGKFFGLAGVRLGFALAGPELAARLSELAGPWAASGPAIRLGRRALANREWHSQTTARLAEDAQRLDALAKAKGWTLAGGAHLFRTYETGNALAAQDALARHHIWSRAFPYSATWLRLGLPAPEEWPRVEAALAP